MSDRTCPMIRVSVVMPTYNQAKFIREAIDSILAQTFRDFELIVVNDGSTDDTEAIVMSYMDPRIRYVKKPHGGTGSALNEGFRHASGEYESWWASDNVMAPDALRVFHDFLNARPDVGFVYGTCDVHVMDSTGLAPVKITPLRKLLPPNGQVWDYDKLTHYYFLSICWMWRRQVRERVGDFTTEVSEDYDHALRMAEAGVRFHFLDRCLGWFRKHDASTGARLRRSPDPVAHQKRIVRDARIRRFPRKAWFYWGDKTLPYLRYLSLYSFCKQNPDWEVTLFRPTRLQPAKVWPDEEHRYELTCPDYSGALAELPLRQARFDAATLGLSNDLSEVHKSDFLRLHLLATTGGLWSDMDVVYFAPLDLPLYYDTYLCDGPYGHSIGFLASTPDNPVFQFLLEEARRAFARGDRRYQAAGAILFDEHRKRLTSLDRQNTKHFPCFDKTIFHIPMETIYAYDAMNIPAIYDPHGDGGARFTERSIGCHWYGGHALAGEACNSISEDNWPRLTSVLGRAIQRALA